MWGERIVFTAPAVASLGLGVWQLMRIQWKKELMQQREETLKQEIPFASVFPMFRTYTCDLTTPIIQSHMRVML